jgi:hypothetical protein
MCEYEKKTFILPSPSFPFQIAVDLTPTESPECDLPSCSCTLDIARERLVQTSLLAFLGQIPRLQIACHTSGNAFQLTTFFDSFDKLLENWANYDDRSIFADHSDTFGHSPIKKENFFATGTLGRWRTRRKIRSVKNSKTYQEFQAISLVNLSEARRLLDSILASITQLQFD